MALLFRSWASRTEPLQVLGPPDALDLCRDWVDPADPVTFTPLETGQSIMLGTYRVRALEAAHEVPTLLYDITDASGTRIFWATDTGPLPNPLSTHLPTRVSTPSFSKRPSATKLTTAPGTMICRVSRRR